MIDVAQFSSTESAYVRFSEEDPRDMRACELITQMYAGMEAPLMTFSRDGVRTLVVPRTIRKVFPDAQPISGEAPSVLRLPNGAGNGNS